MKSQIDNDAPRPLTIWVVRPATAADRAVRRAENDVHDISVYRETTAGNFGTNASDVGQTAGNYGRAASEVGTSASNVGQTAGSYGQTASSLPSNVPSQTAGSYGQTAGSFGTAASNYTGAEKSAQAAAAESSSRAAKGSRWNSFIAELTGEQFQLRVEEVNALDLRARLDAVAHSPLAPDVLLSDRMPDWWPEAERGLTVVRLGQLKRAMLVPDETPRVRNYQWHPYAFAYGLVSARHPESVRDFLQLWFGDTPFPTVADREGLSAAEQTAKEAVAAVLQGGGLQDIADPTMAQFDSKQARAEAFNVPPDDVPDDLNVQVRVVSRSMNKRFAVVSLLATCVSRRAFGMLRPLVVLRTDDDGRWRVLQISLGLSESQVGKALELMQPYTLRGAPRAAVAVPRLASPEDASQRQARAGLRLAWDNGGDDGLLVVEWQPGTGSQRPASSLFLLDDQHDRQRTDVTAPFASMDGPVRWRVWAVGHGGLVAFSDWRSVTLIP